MDFVDDLIISGPVAGGKKVVGRLWQCSNVQVVCQQVLTIYSRLDTVRLVSLQTRLNHRATEIAIELDSADRPTWDQLMYVTRRGIILISLLRVPTQEAAASISAILQVFRTKAAKM